MRRKAVQEQRQSSQRLNDDVLSDDNRKKFPLLKKYGSKVLTLLLCLMCVYLWIQVVKLRGDQQLVPSESENIAGLKSTKEEILEARIERKDAEIVTLRKLLHKAEKAKSVPEDENTNGKQDSIDSLKKRLGIFEKNKQRVETALQYASKEILLQKYGNGPVKAEITVRFPESMGEPALGAIEIELAPFEVMPYVVYHWLTQVEHGAWDGCAFIRNAGHVLQASSQDMNGKSLRSRFLKLPLTKNIGFQEYTDDFPHAKYTLGIAGRPGGPDFYINLVDNKRNHGPGGQKSYDIVEEADSCFAKVIDGFDVIKRMKTAPTKKNAFRGLVDNIGIESIRIKQSKQETVSN
mmetsp:Transcript_9604/g.12546  ORF Transcript_9604/g.12546 Transcript_9604/m.12546 type:complete len:349 (-) Transcript_9604:228-1274(-)